MQGFPVARAGQAIGLLGGSFDPPHDGHVHITRAALKRFGLDQVWWLISPGNPLKDQGPAPLKKRLAVAQRLMDHPRVRVTALEAALGTQFTAHTIGALQARYVGVRFVWLMGADNLAQFHLWQDWRDIMGAVSVGVLARPGQRISARMSRAAFAFRPHRLSERQARALAWRNPPCWAMINVPMNDESSTRLRAAGSWETSSKP